MDNLNNDAMRVLISSELHSRFKSIVALQRPRVTMREVAEGLIRDWLEDQDLSVPKDTTQLRTIQENA